MIYLTRVMTNTAETVRRRLSDNYAWHREIWRAFPDRENEERDFLFRLDRDANRVTVWILSAQKPTPLEWGQKTRGWEIKEVSDTFLTHRRYQFSLRVNPTVMHVVRNDAGERKKNGQRKTIYDATELERWLRNKGEQSGFAIEQYACAPPVKEYFYKQGIKGVHARVDFTGVLTVSDPEKFQYAYQHGIGPAKAFGFGLLLLRPIADA